MYILIVAIPVLIVLLLVSRKMHRMRKEKRQCRPFLDSRLSPDISLEPAEDGALWLKRGEESLQVSFLKEGESFSRARLVPGANLSYAITSWHDRGGGRLLKMELPGKEEALDRFKVTELIDMDKERVPNIDLYKGDKRELLDALDMDNLHFVTDGYYSRFSLMHIYEVSPDGNFILLNRGDPELVTVTESGEPVGIAAGVPFRIGFLMSYRPWIFDVQNREFLKIPWE